MKSEMRINNELKNGMNERTNGLTNEWMNETCSHKEIGGNT